MLCCNELLLPVFKGGILWGSAIIMFYVGTYGCSTKIIINPDHYRLSLSTTLQQCKQKTSDNNFLSNATYQAA